ncbi:MAG TPA: hypothetical protein VMT86_18895 [Bryobacteraceae bacterium]|nr:hypothetical protein [Bryobacteraceae bacterium]
MSWNDAVLSDSTRATQFVQRASLVLVAVAVGLTLALRHHGWIVVGAAAVLLALVAPAFYVLAQRFLAGVRQRETDKRIVLQTRDYLLRWQAIDSAARAESQVDALGPRRTPSSRGFHYLEASPVSPGASELAVCDAAPRRTTGWQFSPRLPHPVTEPLDQLVSPAAARNARRGAPRTVIN